MAKLIAALMILFFVAPAVFATDYTVGDTDGWSQGVNYNTWASGKTFVVGDKLIFTYTPNHEVDEVNESNYNSCGTSNVIENHSGGSTTITLSKTGPMYFVCPTGGHCSQGMKLKVTVTAATTTPTTPPSTPTPPTTPTTPSTTPSPPKSDSPSDAPPTTPDTTTPTTPTPTRPSAATSSYNMNFMVIGASVMLASVFAFMV